MVFLSMMIFFFRKYSCVLNLTVIYERKLRKKPNNQLTTDFATGYHNKYDTFCPHASGLQEGLKQGPFVSSQHGSVLTELME